MLLVKKVQRPRDLKWYQAGAMLYGDWGTSKAYVLGIAFALSGHASWFFLGLMSCLTALVGICYTIICRSYPDGGGAYSSVKSRSQILAVVSAFLLVADYTVTASLSALDAFHYFNVPHPELWAIGTIFLIGAINWVGPTKSGSIAAFIAVLASAAAMLLFLFTIPHLPHVQLSWPSGKLHEHWSVFVGIVLALSGVESIANMTGIMQLPVEKTSKKAIFPVLLEVTIVTFLLGMAMNAIPDLTGHTEDMLRALGDHYIAPWYGHLISVVFGLLLLSAVNTSITGLVSIQFILGVDRELPQAFSKLNRFGMPWLALIVATAVPITVLIFEHDIVGLASLYAVGVVGAITLNLLTSAFNKDISLKKYERFLLTGAGILLFLIEVTICIQKRNALIFATAVIGTGFLLRFLSKTVLPAPVVEPIPADVNVLTVSEAREIAPLYKCSFLVSMRSLNAHLLEEAALRAKALGENAIYLNYVEAAPPAFELPQEIEPSKESIEILNGAQKVIEKHGMTGVPVWQFGDDVGHQIARAASELGVNTVMIGSTRRTNIMNLLRGDVLKTLSRNLPRNCHLIISG